MIGKHHRKLVDDLEAWFDAGPPVCIVQGFSGSGKSTVIFPTVAQRVVGRAIIVSVDVPESNESQRDDLLMALSEELAAHGLDQLATALDEGKGAEHLESELQSLMSHPILLVLDEFQRALGPDGTPHRWMSKLLTQIGNRIHWPGRALLLTSRNPTPGDWSRKRRILSLSSLDAEDGRLLLDELLTKDGRGAQVPATQRDDVVAWTDGNPLALELVVSALAEAPLEELIGLLPEAWELRDREVSPELLSRLHQQLILKVTTGLSAVAQRFLLNLSVFRKAFDRYALDIAAPQGTAMEDVRSELVARRLLTHDAGWYRIHQVAREVVRRGHAVRLAQLTASHGMAGAYYARHFRAKQIVGGGRLGGAFVEARYHFAMAGRSAELTELSSRFEAYLYRTIAATSPVPRDQNELEERVAMLAGLLKHEGPKGLEYHLSRCFMVRGRTGDLDRALLHAARAIGPNAPADAWVHHSRVLAALHRHDEAIAILRRGMQRISPDKGLLALCQETAQRLAALGRRDEALDLLREGIERIPPDKGVFALYREAAQQLAALGRGEEAVALLREGIERVPPDKSLFSLYQEAAQRLAALKRDIDAVALLREGVRRIPEKQNRHRVFESLVYLLASRQRAADLDAIAKGKAKIPTSALDRRLAGSLALLVRGQFPSAAHAARSGSELMPYYITTRTLEAWCWLCDGQPDRANAALEAFPGQPRYEPENSLTWLACLIAVERGDAREAARLFAVYRGVADAEAPTRQQLLADRMMPGSTHAYYYPVISAAFAGDHADLSLSSSTRRSSTPMQPLITWVHLSDIHASHGKAKQRWDQKLVMQRLIGDLAQIKDRGDPIPDLMLVTGDLACRGGDEPGEYDTVRSWLSQAAQAVGLSPSSVFLVPGNHDVSWNTDDGDRNLARLRDALREAKDDLDTVLAHPGDRALLLQRQHAYLILAQQFASESAHPYWMLQRSIRGLRLRLIGLNTALLARERDAGHLALGLEQWAKAAVNVQPDEFVVVMSHHPLTGGWLRDQKDMRTRIRAVAHVYLAGHVHDAESEGARAGNGAEMVTVVAGATHASTDEDACHSYNLAAVCRTPDDGLELRVWPRVWSEKAQQYRTDTSGVQDREHFAVHPLRWRENCGASP